MHDELTQALKSARDDAEPGLYPHLVEYADRAKQAVVHEGAYLRREYPDVFNSGDYQAVFAVGEAASHLVGMARGVSGLDVVALATRRPLLLEDRGGWGDTTVTLPEGTWTDRLTGQTFTGTVLVRDVLDVLPTALLVADHLTA